ncbi:hypothetical protein BDR26DRAFT_863349 [Obelidium mucronatum]|nr:hypothetical protein BDR26DRAFT_863349 [Obelidium mucronatum]
MLAIGKAYIDGTGGVDKHIGWAITWLQQAAARDSSEAMVLLGKIHIDGHVQKWESKRKNNRTDQEIRAHDVSIAADWFTRAAYAGDFEGMVKLGKCYEKGSGVPKDERKAFEWYYLAASKGFSRAQNLTGWCYWQGFGVPMDAMEACKWYRKAAEAGLVEGQTNLALAYCHGWAGGYRDRTEAAHWFWAAAVTGNDAKCAFELGHLIERGNGVQRDPFKAFGWFLCAAEGGFVKGMERVGRYLVDGLSVRVDKAEGFRWYQRAVENGSLEGLVQIGLMFLKGDYVSQDYSKAIILFGQAAEKGSTKGKFHLALCHENGWGVTKNSATAVTMYQSLIAAANSDTKSQPVPIECYYRLGYCYEYGKGVAQDYEKAYRQYEKSYREYPPSCTALARFYQIGLGGATRDPEKAFRYYEYAAAKGDVNANYQVGLVYASRANAASQSPDSARTSTTSDVAAENMNIAVRYFRHAASYRHAPAMFKLGSLFLGDPKSSPAQLEEGVQLVMEAAGLGDADAMEHLSKLYSRGVEVDATGQLVKLTESRLNLFSSKSSSEGGGRFSLTGRLSATAGIASSKTAASTLPTPPELANGSSGSVAGSFTGYVILPKDMTASNRWKQEAQSVRREKDALDAAIAKAVKKKAALPDSLTDALEKLKL